MTKFEDLEADAVYAMLGSKDAMTDFEGATQSAADAVEGSIGNRMKSAWRNLQLGIADVVNGSGAQEFFDTVGNKADEIVPKIVNVVEKAFELANTIRTHWTPIRETVIGIAVAVGVFKAGMVAMSIVSTITGFIKAYRAAVVAGTAAQWLMNAALLANPIGIVIGVVAALTAGIVLLYRNSEKFRGIWDSVWNGVKRAASSAVNGVIEEINRLISTINRIPGVNIPIIPKVQWGNVQGGGSKQVYSAKPAAKGPQMASYDVGSNRINQDQVAQIHKGEMILPSRQAEKVRQAGGNINNIDKMVSSPSTTGGQNVTFGNIIINAKGVTSTEVVNEIVPKLKLALSNM